MELEIIYQDKFLIAINKPHGLLVHRSKIARDVDVFALQLLRDQIGQKVYPSHRLDRKTSGVLLFALNEETDKKMKLLFAENLTKKVYYTIVRGFVDGSGEIDYPLTREDGRVQEAQTLFEAVEKTEVNVPLGKFETSRYSYVKVMPKTGRMHQIRKHFAHIFHPIIGDRPHGCNKQNKLFKNKWGMDTMMLHAHSLSFQHPETGEQVLIKADFSEEFKRVKDILSISTLI